MKKHIIYSNYDADDYKEGAIENILYNFADEYADESEIPENVIYDEVYDMMEMYWEDEEHMMREFFDGKTLLVRGTFGSWHGDLPAGKVITYGELWKCWKDCDYIELYDEGGHFYIKASHHDGTNCYEVKLLTEKGAERYDNWEDDWNDPRSDREIHDVLWNDSHYTHIPHYAREVFGCKTR